MAPTLVRAFDVPLADSAGAPHRGARAVGPAVLQRKVYKRNGRYESSQLPGRTFANRVEALDAEHADRSEPLRKTEYVEHEDARKQDRQSKRQRDIQKNRKQRARIGKSWKRTLDERKRDALGLREVDPVLKASYEKHEAAEIGGDYGTQGLALELSREDKKDGPFDEHYDQPRLMWRTDTRSPREVLHPHLKRKEKRRGLKQEDIEGGFQTSAERERITRKGEGRIIYRTGLDDITSASGISVSPDIRSASFFPFGSKKGEDGKQRQRAYLYAIAADHTVNTFEAQKRAEHVETGERHWRDKRRFQYDPTERNAEDTSTVWPYREHAMHRVGKDQIIAAYEVHHERMDGSDSRAGSAFHVTPARMPRSEERRGRDHPLRESADLQAALYQKRYPSQPKTFSSYQGQVSFHQVPESLSNAEDAVVRHEPFAPGRSIPKPGKLARQKAARERANQGRKGKGKAGNARAGSFKGR